MFRNINKNLTAKETREIQTSSAKLIKMLYEILILLDDSWTAFSEIWKPKWSTVFHMRLMILLKTGKNKTRWRRKKLAKVMASSKNDIETRHTKYENADLLWNCIFEIRTGSIKRNHLHFENRISKDRSDLLKSKKCKSQKLVNKKNFLLKESELLS